VHIALAALTPAKYLQGVTKTDTQRDLATKKLTLVWLQGKHQMVRQCCKHKRWLQTKAKTFKLVGEVRSVARFSMF
jgi:hypothetical protein